MTSHTFYAALPNAISMISFIALFSHIYTFIFLNKYLVAIHFKEYKSYQCISDEFQVDYGVPQENVPGPLFFVLDIYHRIFIL